MKNSCMMFALTCIVLLVTACSLPDYGIAPSGVQQVVVQQSTEDYDYYHEYDDATPTAVNAPAAKLENSDILRLSMRHPLTLNPLTNEDETVARILRLIFEPLIVLDSNLRPTSHLADIEFASDFSSVSLTIRSDAFWSDGMPVTSDDIIFSIQTLRNASSHAIYRQNVQNIANVTRQSTRVVHVYFHNSTVCAAMSLGFPIIPQHHYRTQATRLTNMNPIGNGPFMLQNLSHMRGMRLEQNPYSFRTPPHASYIDVIFLSDQQTDMYAFDQGLIDAINLPLTEWARHHSVRHIRHEIVPAMFFEFIGFNFENEIFTSEYTRQGIAHAFNIDAAIDAVYLTHAVRTTSPIHPYFWAASNVQGLPYNPQRARVLLNTAFANYPLVIIANNDNFQRVSIANRLAASLIAVGVPAVVEAVPYEEYFTRLQDGDFDLFIGGVNLSFAPDIEFLFNGSGIFMYDPQLISNFAATGLAVTEAMYIQAIAAFQQNFAERVPVISLGFRHSGMLTNMRVIQPGTPAPDNVFGDVNQWLVGTISP